MASEMVKVEADRELPCSLTKTGVVWARDPTFDEWEAVGALLANARELVHWWIGDWLVMGCAQYQRGQYEAAVKRFGFAEATVRNDKFVASRVESVRRRTLLSWSHHREVASFEANEQDGWLSKAEQNDWTRHQLRKAITDSMNGRKRQPKRCKPFTERPQAPEPVSACVKEIERRGAEGFALTEVAPAYGMSYSSFRRVRFILNSQDEDLISAVDDQIISIDVGSKLVDATPDERRSAIAAARAKAGKARSSANKSQGHILLDLLSRTALDWHGFSNGRKLSSRDFPRRSDRLDEVRHLVRNIRQYVNTLLDSIEEVMECLPQTAEKNNS